MKTDIIGEYENSNDQIKIVGNEDLMRFTSIASGSSGNCTYIGSDNTHILIDAGVSKKRIEEGLNGLDLTLSDIDAIFVFEGKGGEFNNLQLTMYN